MGLSRRHIASLVIASSVGGAALMWGAMNAEAASATATASVTVTSTGGVGTVPETTTTPTTTTPVTITSTTTAGFSIRTTPAPSATSALGSGPVAPVATTTTPEAGSGSSSSSSAGTSGTSGAPRFSNPNVSSAGLGAASAVAVEGSPFQAFSFMLPELTVYTTSGQLVTLSNFQHTGGNTPFLGNDGAGFFNIGAQVNQAPLTVSVPALNPADNQNAQQQLPAAIQAITSSLADNVLIGSDRATVIAAAFSSRSPYVDIVVSYN